MVVSTEVSISETPGTSGVSHSKKRARESGDTPHKVSRKPRIYALAVGKELVVYVEYVENPWEDLTKDDPDHIRSGLVKLIFEWEEESEVVPRFKESGLVQGKFKVTCADETSVRWLLEATKSLSAREGVRYSARRATDPLPLKTAMVCIPGPPPYNNPLNVIKMLQRQNPAL